MLDVKVGDEVVVHDGSGSRKATVTRVGTKLFDVTYGPVGMSGRIHSFRLKDGRSPTQTTGVGVYVRTLEQEAISRRWTLARGALMRNNINLQPCHAFTLEQVEQLAALVTEFSKEEQ